ncbi:hypothetical protein [uncultured Adlercreutzia sp.]|uniref:hypothetical protein n=1 Tax=uncultured Adlercreutzia sp. TaxID=875803 RepID=UPI0026758FBB|nr:hypothetical protein [uncultured Adlercreutzia sp.]
MKEEHPGAPLDLMDREEEIAYNPLEFIEGDEEDDPDLAGLITDDAVLLPHPLGQTPARLKRATVFTPEGAGSAEAAVIDLARTNAGRRPILLGILAWARDGIGSDELFERIEEAETYNKSVYAPVSYCRMLERAGGLAMERPDKPATADDEAAQAASPEAEAVVPEAAALSAEDEEAVGYLSLEEAPEPRWRTTEAGLAALAKLTDGEAFRSRVLDEDARYAEVYRAVMEAMGTAGAPREELCALAETFPVTREPRKMGSYFLDVLESVDAARWADGRWALTDLGASLFAEVAALTCADGAGAEMERMAS